MEPVFKTETIHDLTLHREFVSASEHTHLPLSLIQLLMTALIIFAFSTSRSSVMWIYLLFFGSYLIIKHIVRNSKKGDIQYKRMLQSNQGQPVHMITEFGQECITHTDYHNGNKFHYTYDQFRSIIDTPNLLILMLQHRSCLVIEKRWLKGGSVKELTAFLFEKCTNIKRKKLRRGIGGKWISRLLHLVIFVGVIWSLANLPMFSLWDRITGKQHNGISYLEMADALREEAGIVISDDTIMQIVQSDQEYAERYGVEFYSDNRYASKVMDLLYWEGTGSYDPETWEWTPSTSGVYWFDMEVMYLDSIYTDFFRGLSAMDPELDFQNIQENYGKADLESGVGSVSVSFRYLEKDYSLEAEYYYDWFDTHFLQEIGTILAADHYEKDLYLFYDGQSVLMYYGTKQQVRTLERLTGEAFHSAAVSYPMY